MIRVHLLGSPETTWADEPLEITRRQPRAILYRLAAQLEPIPRSHLCLLFWPDIPESEARRHLSNQIYNLRRALPVANVIQKSGGWLSLDSRQAWSDVATFERLSQSSETQALQQAVDLYRGPFLDGFSLLESGEFESWAERERRNLERLYLETLSALMTNYAAQGEADSAIDCGRRYLEIDDLAEEVHRRLIDLYTAQGDRGAARRQYEWCAAVLERELGVDPLPETREVYMSVLAERAMSPEPSHMLPAWTTLPSLDAPLVGRDEAMARLQNAFSHASAGAGSAVLVSGEAGVGKSRLLEEFATKHAGDATVLIGSGYQAEGETPYLSLAEALRPILPAIDWPLLGADPLHLAQLLHLFPELRRYVPGLAEPPATEQEQEESPLFRALAHLMLCLARQYRPLVLCLDDLHWTDETTRSWMGYLGRRLREAPLLLMGGYRTEEAEAVEPLRVGLDRLKVLINVGLKGLSEREVTHLIRRLSGKTAGIERFCRRLHQQTGGNPFFLLETLRALFETGVLLTDNGGWGGHLDQITVQYGDLPWPESVTEIVRRRMRRLRPAASQVLEAGAVIGRRFDLDLLQATSGRSEREVVDALDELTARQLITVREDQYQFRHDLIRSIVSDDLSYGRSRLLHRRAGQALESQEPDNAAALAQHFAEAGETRKAIDYSLKAGKQARLVYAHAEAVDHYQRAAQLLKAAGEEEQAARTLMTLGLTYHNAFQFKESRVVFEEAFLLQQRAVARPSDGPLPPAPHPLRMTWIEPVTLDPSLSASIGGAHVIRQIFSGLLARTPELEMIPDLARSWEVLDGGRAYRFHLRRDVRWSDGTPLTAADFEYTWKRILDPATGSRAADILYDIKGARTFHKGVLSDPDQVGVRALDEETLRVELEQPTAYFLQLLAHETTYPIPRHVVEAYGQEWTEVANIVTSGPFLLEERQQNERIVLKRNPAHHGPFTGNLERIEFILLDADPPQLVLYEADVLDALWSTDLPPEERARAQRKFAEDHLQGPWLFTEYVGFDTRRPPFEDPRVRRAFAMALDRERLANEGFKGLYPPATGGFVPPGMPGHTSGIALPYDPERARTLLAEAGYPRGQGFPEVEALTRGGGIPWQGAQGMQAQWRQNLGLEIRWSRLESQVLYARAAEDPPHIWAVGWVADYPDPYNFLGAGVERNVIGWKHSGYRQLLKQTRHATDQAGRMRLFRKAEEILIEQAPLIPIRYGQNHMLLKPWVRNYPVSAMDGGFYQQVVIEPH